MTKLKIEFSFKSFQPRTIPQPILEVTLKHNNATSRVRCVVDSGADICTFPMDIGMFELQIDFTKIAGNEMNNRWDSIDKANHKEVEKFMKELSDKKLAMKTFTECACSAKTPSYLYPIEITILDKTWLVPIIWTPKNISALLGRQGFFDQGLLVLDVKNQKGYFEF